MTSDEGADASAAVLVFAPVGRDAALTQELLQRAGIANIICRSMMDLCDLVENGGGGALLLTEEALDDGAASRLTALLAGQPSWADIPILLFAGAADTEVTPRTVRWIEALRNVTLFERPIRIAAVLSAIRAALRARARQYEVRDLLAELRDARAAAEGANRLKDEFLAMLSHELRTPLNAIVGWTSMLTRGQVDSERMPRVFASLDRNARAQAQLIADVLDVSRIVTGKLQLHLTMVDVCALVTDAADSVRAEGDDKGVRLVVETESHPCVVRADPGRLRQIVWNLLNNAFKFTPAGGSVTVQVTRGDGDVAIVVSDTGDGISPQFLPHVFDRFRQADQTSTRVHGGLGLGLSIVKDLVELHGGTVQASSDGEGQGASFAVRLPAPEHSPADLTAAEAAPPETR